MSTLLGHTKNMSISLFVNKINEPSLQRVNVFWRSAKGQKAWFWHLGEVSKHQEKTLFWWFRGWDNMWNKKCRTFDEFFSYFVHPHIHQKVTSSQRWPSGEGSQSRGLTAVGRGFLRGQSGHLAQSKLRYLSLPQPQFERSALGRSRQGVVWQLSD